MPENRMGYSWYKIIFINNVMIRYNFILSKLIIFSNAEMNRHNHWKIHAGSASSIAGLMKLLQI